MKCRIASNQSAFFVAVLLWATLVADWCVADDTDGVKEEIAAEEAALHDDTLNQRDTSSPHSSHHPAVATSVIPQGVFRVMPLGDSISICCNYCAVPAGVLVRKDLHEPPTPWDGYIRNLWHKLKAEELRQAAAVSSREHQHQAEDTFRFTYVGRVHTCMVNRSETMRVPADWDIRYEGYYGYTTSRVLSEVVAPALQVNDPDVVLLMLGTNDLIQAKAGGRLGRVGNAIQNLKAIVGLLLTTPRADSKDAGRSRHVLIGKVPPIRFSQIKAVPPAARKPHRVASLNREIEKLVVGLVEAQKQRYIQLRGQAAAASFLPSIAFVDMYQNLSVTEDLHGDGLHPNHHGEEKISTEWFRGLGPLMHAPEAFRNIPAAQNDDALLQQAMRAEGKGQNFPPITKPHKRDPSSMQEPPLFGERPTSSWDRAVFPAVIFTVMAYAFLVCRPTQRLTRQWVAAATTLWHRGFTSKPKPAPQ
ncbi:GDSL-family lipase, putative [Bodo saltans]|uniref:GDSL-family lipase, putative n=1 Tax=Bodo saltans TaxID=75058 RepID=A0A0S4JNG8_BODSA|nr:GDSL-family lipase, putative [Bodo saltans]|eukprot:CUG92198.1 GDSL-family lipase, putative [Bodo saltans]